MLITVSIVFFVSVTLANGDVYNEIRSEEEQHHNVTLSKYVKAALGGALHSLFPSVTESERAEAEKLFADVFPIGDPSRPLADNEEKIESLLCRNHRERGTKILAYVRKRWPTHLITHITVRLGIHSIGEKNDEYCRDAASRSVYTTNASVINQHTNELNVARNKYIDANLVIVYANSTINKLAIVCCSYFNFKTQLLNAIPNEQTKRFVTDYIHGYNGPAVKYLCVYHSEGSKACADLAIPAPPANVPRFTSSFTAAVESLSKLTSISA